MLPYLWYLGICCWLMSDIVVPGMALAARGQAPFSTTDANWQTDFSRHTVPLQEIRAGGPPRDGIPPLDRPRFVDVATADTWLRDREPVIVVQRQNVAKAYPLQILIWHEIVNDTLGDEPITVTFCPLCNSAIAFQRRLDTYVLDFGTTGRLRHSDLVMWDRQTESWWQQFTGEAIIGTLAGKRLTMVPVGIVSYAAFKQAFPEGKVLSQNTGFPRDYGCNPYVGYDDIDSAPFLLSGAPDPRLSPMERVVAVSLEGIDKAYPYRLLAEKKVLYDTLGSQSIVVLYQAGTASALDQGSIAQSRDVGATGVLMPQLDGRQVMLAPQDNGFRDTETGSTWDILGKAIAGPLAGRHLPAVVHGNHFVFAWFVFKPQTQLYGR